MFRSFLPPSPPARNLLVHARCTLQSVYNNLLDIKEPVEYYNEQLQRVVGCLMTSRRVITYVGGCVFLKKMIRVVAGLCLALLLGLPLFSQVNTGRILGSVTDQTGGVIAGAMVTVTNTETGVARNLVTDGAGEYIAPNLNPGKYSVRASAAGFQTFERQNIDLEVGKDARIDAQLTPGQVTQTVTVSETIPLL